MTDVEMTPGQQLALERMECVCRECYKLPTQRRHRNYCASCGKPFAWPAGTTPPPRAEALAQVRAEERARCVAIASEYTMYGNPGPVQQAANEICDAIEEV